MAYRVGEVPGQGRYACTTCGDQRTYLMAGQPLPPCICDKREEAEYEQV
jgi:hypothetical protein